MATILVSGQKVLVDDDDLERISALRWHLGAGRTGKKRYVIHSALHSTIYLHRFVLSCQKGFQVDHINGNSLDNRKENLRLCTNAQNNRNKGKIKTGTSHLKGVYLRKDTLRWAATLKINYKKISLGCFDTAEEAHQAYCKAAVRYHGNFARFE